MKAEKVKVTFKLKDMEYQEVSDFLIWMSTEIRDKWPKVSIVGVDG